MINDLAGEWARIAREEFEWFEPWHTTLDSPTLPFYKWFVGGKTNIVYNALDRHSKPGGAIRSRCCGKAKITTSAAITYHQLHREVCRFASVLRAMGVRKGDRVTIYMGRIPEMVICDAGLRQDRRGAFGGLRRIFGRGAARAHRRQPEQSRHHR